ncbi:hypothetical protein ACFYPK_33475, partial [Streptomyces halstedii]|uniref:hypothetical protein n=1 Tax=Streptomyces halstedii TaxID=1944 RepID=UPI00345F41E9
FAGYGSAAFTDSASVTSSLVIDASSLIRSYTNLFTVPPCLVWATLTATGLGCALAVRALSRTGALAGREPAAAVAT